MPLTKQQKEFIEISIDHLIDLPKELKSTELFIKKMHSVFKQEIKDQDDEPFHSLQECLFSPTQYIQQIEKQSHAPITIGEVQTHILDFSIKKIKKVTNEKLPWSRAELLKNWKTHADFEEKFISKPSHSSHDLFAPSFSPPPQVDRLFSKRLILNEEFQIFQATVDVKVPRPELKTFNLEEIDEEDFETNEEQMAYLKEELSPVAEMKAINLTAKKALSYLVEEKVILAKEAEDVSQGAKKVLTYGYYFNLIKDKKIPFSDIQHITQVEANSLCSFATIDLLQSKKINFFAAKKVNKKIIENSFYFRKLMEGQIEVNELFDLNDDQVKNLVSPNIIHLLEQKKILMKDVKGMSTPGRLLLENIFYYELFKKGEIPFNFIKTLSKLSSLVFLNVEIIKLLGSQKADYKSILAIKNPLLLFFIAEDILKYDEVKLISSSLGLINFSNLDLSRSFNKSFLRKLIEEFLILAADDLLFEKDLLILFDTAVKPLRFELKDEGTTSPSFLCRYPAILEGLIQNVYSRIYSLVESKPMHLHKDKVDNLNNIISNLQKHHLYMIDIWSYIVSLRVLNFYHFTQSKLEVLEDINIITRSINELVGAHFPPDQFYSSLAKHLLKGIISHLEKVNQPELKSLHDKLEQEFNATLALELKSRATRSNLDIWIKSFSSVVEYAKNTLHSYQPKEMDQPPAKRQKISPRLFASKTHSVNEDLKKQCEILCLLARQIPNLENEPKRNRLLIM